MSKWIAAFRKADWKYQGLRIAALGLGASIWAFMSLPGVLYIGRDGSEYAFTGLNELFYGSFGFPGLEGQLVPAIWSAVGYAFCTLAGVVCFVCDKRGGYLIGLLLAGLGFVAVAIQPIMTIKYFYQHAEAGPSVFRSGYVMPIVLSLLLVCVVAVLYVLADERDRKPSK